MPGIVRVLIVEDHPVFRRGLRDALDNAPNLDVMGEAATCFEALDLAHRQRPTVALVDIQLPDGSGLQLVEALTRFEPPVPVVVLSAHPHLAYVESAIEKGAAGYLLKDELAPRIVQAVHGAAHGQTGWFSESVRDQLLQAQRDPLTPKETEVVTLLSHGRTLPEVAKALAISPRTVRNHLGNVYAKLDLHSQPEVVAWAWRNGIAEPC